MDPLDSDGEPNARPISIAAARLLVDMLIFAAPDGPSDRADCDDVDPHRCTLCSVTIPPTADRLVWTWTPEDARYPVTLHAHRGCDAIRREIDLGEWSEGDLVDRLVEWADDDPFNHDLQELDANLTPEQRADMGGEVIAAAIRSLAQDELT